MADMRRLMTDVVETPQERQARIEQAIGMPPDQPLESPGLVDPVELVSNYGPGLAWKVAKYGLPLMASVGYPIFRKRAGTLGWSVLGDSIRKAWRMFPQATTKAAKGVSATAEEALAKGNLAVPALRHGKTAEQGLGEIASANSFRWWREMAEQPQEYKQFLDEAANHMDEIVSAEKARKIKSLVEDNPSWLTTMPQDKIEKAFAEYTPDVDLHTVVKRSLEDALRVEGGIPPLYNYPDTIIDRARAFLLRPENMEAESVFLKPSHTMKKVMNAPTVEERLVQGGKRLNKIMSPAEKTKAGISIEEQEAEAADKWWGTLLRLGIDQKPKK